MKQPRLDGEAGQGSEEPARALSPDPVLAKAEATLWPFSPGRGQPMGALVDTKPVDPEGPGLRGRKRLGCQRPRGRPDPAAAATGPEVPPSPPPAGFMKWISGGSSFTHRRQMQINLLEGLTMGILFGAALTAFGIYLFSQPTSFYASLNFGEILNSPTAIAGRPS